MINIDGFGTKSDPYPCESSAFQVASLSFRAYRSRAFIACKKNTLEFSCAVNSNSSVTVSFERITFLNTAVRLVNCNFKTTGVNFFNNLFDALSHSFAQGVQGKIELDGCLFQNNSANSVKINGNLVQLDITNTIFAYNQIKNKHNALLNLSAQGWQPKIIVNFTNITVVGNRCPGIACFALGSGNNTGFLTMAMDKGKFESNQAGARVLDIRGDSTIELNSVLFAKNNGRAINIESGKSMKFFLVNGNFVNNNVVDVEAPGDGGAIFVSGFKQNALVFISRSNFTSNKGQNGGACAILDVLSLRLNIERCTFSNNGAQDSGGAVTIGTNYHWQTSCAVNIHNSTFIGNVVNDRGDFDETPSTRDSGGGGALALYVFYMGNFTLINNTFVNNRAKQRHGGAVRAKIKTMHGATLIQHCKFLRNEGTGDAGTFELTVKDPWEVQPRVTIQKSTFMANKGYGFTRYDIFLNHSYLLLSFCKLQGNSAGGIYVGLPNVEFCDVRVENSVFTDNKNFAFRVSNKNCNGANLNFTNTSIARNNCKVKSSIFQVALNYIKNSLLLQSSQFEENFCLSGVAQILVSSHDQANSLFHPQMIRVEPGGTAVILRQTVFRENTGVAKSTLTIKDASEVKIQQCRFVNNFGGNDGSHLRIQLRWSVIHINKTVFRQTEKSMVFNTPKEQPYNGFLTVTSFGDLHMRDTSFLSDHFSLEGKTLIFVKGASQVYMTDSVKIQGPVGSKLFLHNFTHFEDFKRFQHWITSFSMSYWPCPVGTYSIRRGTSRGFAIGDQIKCHACPAGADCKTTLAARPNFWGYPVGDHVHFTLCPQGYCCSDVNQTCRYHNETYLNSGCQGNRTGTLCGSCKKRFSEDLFHNSCVAVKYCTQHWYLVLAFICAMLFALYLTRKPPLFQKLMKNLTWFLPNEKGKVDNKEVDRLENNDEMIGHSPVSSNGFLKIIFYFYQVAGLLTVSSYGMSGLLKKNIVLPLVGLLDFKLYGNNNWNICPFPGITPLTKTLSQLAVVMVTFLSILFIYLFHSGLNKLLKRSPVLPESGPYLAAILETVLLGYSAGLGTAIRLLDCKQIQDQLRWNYNAEITCFQWWQKVSIAAIVLYMFPFIFTVYIGSIRLYRQQISARRFLLACVFPLPFLLLGFVVHLLKVMRKSQDVPSAELQESRSKFSRHSLEAFVFEVLSAPFCKPNLDQHSPCKIYWESILIGRRFVLILIGCFVAHALLRSVLLAVLCLIFLLHHISQNPFGKFSANLAETVSLATLVVIAIMNVGVASYYSAGTEPRDIMQQYIQVFSLTEGILLSFIPFVFVAFVLLSLASQLFRLGLLLVQEGGRFLRKSKTRKQNQSEDEDPLLSPVY